MNVKGYTLPLAGLLALGALAPPGAQAQSGRAGRGATPWTEDGAARTAASNSPYTPYLRAFRPVSIDLPVLRQTLAAAPLEGTAQRGAALIVTLPMPDGSEQRFQLVESPIMEPGLAAQFPTFKTYSGIGLDDPTATVRADVTDLGFHAQVLSWDKGTVFIDPVSYTDQQHYVSFYKRDISRTAFANRQPCGFVGNSPSSPVMGSGTSGPVANRVSGSVGTSLRSLRTAVAATGEYTAFHGGTVALGQAAIVTAVNRVTGVYEKEIATRLVLVANNSSLVYTNANTDPYTNNNPSSLLSQNQTNCNSVIGSANYDLGHVFSTAGGGLAGLGVVCGASKAQGETGTSSPINDAFYIDYVAHEMGHQLGANHTFNSSTSNCGGGNRNASTAIEPGSGTTIMAYAGICGADDVAAHSDAYFCYSSFEEIRAKLAAVSCYTSVATGNTVPTVTVPADKSIPASTPFKLTAAGSDADGDALTYNWEDVDLGASVTLTAAQAAGDAYPLFRSFTALTSPTRYFPQLANIIANTSSTADKLPTVARNLKFRCTVRDEHFSAAAGRIVGGVNNSSVVTLAVINTGAAFAMTAPNTAVSLTGGAATTVTWNVAGTTASPISCANVNILLSTDGGLTYPTTLLAATPNDGTQAVTLPNVSTSTARIMVEAADNYFFDISNANFTITATPAPTVTGLSPTSGFAGTSVTITGTNFTGATAVSFNGTAATYTVNSATQITATVPAGATTGGVSVTTAGGTGTSTGVFTVLVAPTVTALSPNSGLAGTSVTITGTSFTGATSVKFNGTNAASFTVNSATSITATVPAGATTGGVSVTTGGGTGTSTGVFTVLYPPVINAQTFSIAENSANGTVVGTVVASDPNVGETLTYSITAGNTGGAFAINATTGQLTVANVAVLDFEATPSFGLTVSVADNGSPSQNASATVTVNLTNVNEAPSLLAQTFSSIPENSANGTTVGGVLATDPDAGTTLTYSITAGNTGGAFSFVGNQLRVANAAMLDFETTPAFFLTVQVSDGSLTASATITVNLSNVMETPTVASFSPASGSVGTTVTVTGTNFQGAGAVTVKFNGTTATTVSVSSATSLTAVVPTGATTGLISVTNADGTGSSATSFVVGTLAAPTVSSFTPTSAVTGTSVTITGTNLSTATAVKFNGVAATSFTVNSATSITATVPDDAITGKISVTTLGGTATSAGNFKVLPTMTSFSPATGVPGDIITITGSGYTDATSVKFSTVTTTSLTIVDANTIAVAVPAGATTGKLTVTTPGGAVMSATNFTVGPIITGFSPAQGAVGSLVIVTGTNFVNPTTVSFNGTAATTTYNSTTQLTATVPAGATTGGVSVSNVNGTTTSVTSFTVVAGAAPAVSSFTPASGVAGTVVTITGSGFTGATEVKFNTLAAASFTVNSATSITATAPAGVATGKLFVITPSGMAQSATSFTIALPPTITSFTPTSGPAGTVVTLTGTNYSTTTGVSFNGTPASFTLVSSSSVKATVPAGATTGTITLTNVAGSATSAGTFTVTASPVPGITSFSPASGAVGTNVVITGTELLGATSVTFGGVAATAYTVNSATQITATVPAGALSGMISVTTMGGTAMSATAFSVITPAPTISSFTPTTGLLGTGVTITGTNFTGATDVKFNGTAATFTVNSATSISTSVPAGATTGKITVTTGGGTATSVANFTVQNPTVSSYSPISAVVGTSIAITGTNFTGATSVEFGGVPAASFTVNSATSITAVVSNDGVTGPISVTTPTGTGSSAGTFKVLPTLASFSPASGVPGDIITLSGSGFTNATSVKFNMAVTTGFTVVDPFTITVAVPGTATTGKVYVITPGGTATSATNFTVGPIISSFTPGQGAPGSVVIITGANFVNPTTVSFNGVAATTTYNSSSQLTATIPAGATTGLLSVTNANGTSFSASPFTIVSGAIPTVTSFTPTTGVIVGTVVTINGTNLGSATEVRFNTVNTAAITVISATQVQAAVPAGATSGRVFVITPTGMASSASSLMITQPPTISSFTPTSGPVGTVVTISGLNLTGASSVTFGGVPATTYTVNNSTSISATVPAGAVTGTISVTTIAGTATSAGTFTVTGPRQASRLSADTTPVQVELYPNPATDRVSVQVSGGTGDVPVVELLDATGRMLQRLTLVNGYGTVSVANLPKGVYSVRVSGQVQRLIVE